MSITRLCRGAIAAILSVIAVSALPGQAHAAKVEPIFSATITNNADHPLFLKKADPAAGGWWVNFPEEILEPHQSAYVSAGASSAGGTIEIIYEDEFGEMVNLVGNNIKKNSNTIGTHSSARYALDTHVWRGYPKMDVEYNINPIVLHSSLTQYVNNHSNHVLVLTEFTHLSGAPLEARPNDTSALPPGASHSYKVPDVWFGSSEYVADYAVWGHRDGFSLIVGRIYVTMSDGPFGHSIKARVECPGMKASDGRSNLDLYDL